MRLIAHRGRILKHMENSLAGLAGLPENVEGIEADVRVTVDGVPVMFHDEALGRTTNGGTRRIDETYFSCLQTYRLRGINEPPPSMENYLLHAATRLWSVRSASREPDAPSLYLDVKPDTPEAIEAVVRIAERTPFLDGIVFLVKELAALDILSKIGNGGVRRGLLRCNRNNIDKKIAAARNHGAEVLFVQHGLEAFLSNVDIVPQIRSAGFQVGASILNGPLALGLAREAGCDLVLTDLQ